MAEPIDSLPVNFDPDVYLELNPDVAAAGVDPSTHYISYGRVEGRFFLKEKSSATPYDFDGLKTIHNHDFMQDSAFCGAYERGVRACGADYQWYWRVHIGLWAAELASGLAGDYVECGVNKGFLSSAIMEHLDWNKQDRMFYLLDTFSGIASEHVTEAEIDAGILESNAQNLSIGFYTEDFDSVKQNFAEWQNGIQLIRGAIPDTLDQVQCEKIAFVHLDLNCSLPEVEALEAFWERLSPGAPVLLDDYAYSGYHSQKLAMDQFAAKKQVSIVSLPTGQGLLLAPTN